MSQRIFHILLIDDYQNALEIFADLLRGWGYDVTPVSKGGDALRLIDENSFDLVITSLSKDPKSISHHHARGATLHDMDNIEILKSVKRKNPELPVMVFTAYGSVESAVEAMRQGAADYVRKPFSVEGLRLRIESVLAKGVEHVAGNNGLDS